MVDLGFDDIAILDQIFVFKVIPLEPRRQPVYAPVLPVQEQLVGLVFPGQHVAILDQGIHQRVVNLCLHALAAGVEVDAFQLPVLAEQRQGGYGFRAVALSGEYIQALGKHIATGAALDPDAVVTGKRHIPFGVEEADIRLTLPVAAPVLVIARPVAQIGQGRRDARALHKGIVKGLPKDVYALLIVEQIVGIGGDGDDIHAVVGLFLTEADKEHAVDDLASVAEGVDTDGAYDRRLVHRLRGRLEAVLGLPPRDFENIRPQLDADILDHAVHVLVCAGVLDQYGPGIQQRVLIRLGGIQGIANLSTVAGHFQIEGFFVKPRFSGHPHGRHRPGVAFAQRQAIDQQGDDQRPAHDTAQNAPSSVFQSTNLHNFIVPKRQSHPRFQRPPVQTESAPVGCPPR